MAKISFVAINTKSNAATYSESRLFPFKMGWPQKEYHSKLITLYVVKFMKTNNVFWQPQSPHKPITRTL